MMLAGEAYLLSSSELPSLKSYHAPAQVTCCHVDQVQIAVGACSTLQSVVLQATLVKAAVRAGC